MPSNRATSLPGVGWRWAAELVGGVQEGAVIEFAQAGAYLVEVGGQVVAQNDVFSMDRLDMWAKFFKAFAHESGIDKIALRAADHVDGVEVDSKTGTVNGLDQRQIIIG